MASPNIDWNGIRPLNGERSKGFEELCAQLARLESPTNAHFTRKGAPDAGVECFCVLQGGEEWGWQAKYIDDLGDSQWGQIDKSVRTALKKHPRLTRYFVCVPYDRPDAQISGRKSAMEKWNDHVAKWSAEASTLGMSVAFEYWGTHELVLRLSRPEQIGRIRFWFDTRAFDVAWFTSRLDEALKAAGPRYTPEVHVDLPVAAEFETFGRTQHLVRQIKSKAPGIRDRLRSLAYVKLPLADKELVEKHKELVSEVDEILSLHASFDVPPIGDPGFSKVIDQIEKAEGILAALEKNNARCEQAFQQRPQQPVPEQPQGSEAVNRYREYLSRLNDLSFLLDQAKEALVRGQALASRKLLLLKGDAGTGKTHLLCDIAKQRLSQGFPTVLLMGQRFKGANDPWSQALQQMDLASLAADEFVGALEAAAQGANCRALFVIDAVNEGAGRLVWPDNLAAFMAQLDRSPWIGVVLSVRTSYEESIVPSELRTQAVHVRHHGFADLEYNATKTFFQHYGLELPSTPLLNPEFSNPLFLKTLCSGLHAKGETRLPRGFHGITNTMELYLDAINHRLSSVLRYNPNSKLVKTALEGVSLELLSTGKRWLVLSKAEELVNVFLPGRTDFDQSLYHGLVSEGLLVEDIPRYGENAGQVSVYIAFDRFADYLTAKALLDKHLDIENPISCFSGDGALAFLSDEGQYVAPGVLEALFVQVPERTGRELVEVAPKVGERWGVVGAFRKSVVWRSVAACTLTTKSIIEKLLEDPEGRVETLDVLLTVATIPNHPLNALFLDERLRGDPMPTRDGWWTIALHKSWGRKEALDRLVDWSATLPNTAPLDDDVLDLSSICLAWTFTSSNRFLRDHATQALSTMLSGRPNAVVRLIEKFWAVDDPYVLERVYAVAYAVACKSHSAVEVGKIAEVIYEKVFSTGNPPVHILVRDYASGVIQRALYLGASSSIDQKLLRPPYKSAWPEIPSEEEIKPFLPNWSGEEAGKKEWARNRIGSSVMGDDFARYILGTNSSATSHHWLGLKLSDPPWIAPPRYQDLVREFVDALPQEQKAAWDSFEEADKALDSAQLQRYMASWFRKRGGDENTGSEASETILTPLTGEVIDIEGLEEKRSSAHAILDGMLSPSLRQKLIDLAKVKSLSREESEPPGFELARIQRFILKRVFDMGWTTELFGQFDQIYIGYRGRSENKAERIGKKYQWIAYHEILAFLSDHYQFRESYRHYEGGMQYSGPWQEHRRDIDPTCGPKKFGRGDEDDVDLVSWWASVPSLNWTTPAPPDEWVKRTEDFPKIVDLLRVTDPRDGVKWVNGLSNFNWAEEIPPDKKSTDVARREMWCICTGYLIPTANAKAFLEWASKMDFWGRWMPEEPEIHEMFLGEYGWAKASEFFEQQCLQDGGWDKPEKECPTKVEPVAVEYGRSGGGLDCSVEKGFNIKLPTWSLFRGLRLKWMGEAGNFLDERDRLAVWDPSLHEKGPGALLLREDSLREYLSREGLTLCWVVLGERRYLGAGMGFEPSDYFSMHVSGAYVLGDSDISGNLNFSQEERRETATNEEASMGAGPD